MRAHGLVGATQCLEERQTFPVIDERLDAVELDRAREMVVGLPALSTLGLGLESRRRGLEHEAPHGVGALGREVQREPPSHRVADQARRPLSRVFQRRQRRVK